MFDCSSAEEDYLDNSEDEINDTEVIAEVQKQLDYLNRVKNSFQKFFTDVCSPIPVPTTKPIGK